MEQIKKKLDKIILWQNILSDNEKKNFDKETESYLKDLNRSITSINEIMFNYEISENKVNDLELQKKRSKLVCQYLFPYYYTITEIVEKLSPEQLNKELEKSNQL